MISIIFVRDIFLGDIQPNPPILNPSLRSRLHSAAAEANFQRASSVLVRHIGLDPSIKNWSEVGWHAFVIREYVRSTPHPVTVTTRIITFLVGNPYKPPFATVTGRGVDPRNM